MNEYQVMKLLADYRQPDGVIDFNRYLGDRGYQSNLSTCRDFCYDNDAADYCFLLYQYRNPSLCASVKGLDEKSYHEYRMRSRCLKLRLGFWPQELVDDAWAKFWENMEQVELPKSEDMQFDVFRFPVGAVIHVVNLVESHSAL